MIDRLITTAKEKPETLFYLVAGFLVFSLLLVLAIDVYDAFGLRTEWLAGDEERSFFWMHWYLSPIENPMQWFLLALGIVGFSLGAGAAYQRQDQEGFEFALLMSVGMAVMFLEDAADPRHFIRSELEGFFGVLNYGVLGTLVELTYFALVGALLLFPFIRFRKAFWPHEKVRRFMVRGYALYALAVGSSWLGSAFQTVVEPQRGIYTIIGDSILYRLYARTAELEALLIDLDMQTRAARGGLSLGFFLMDRVYEESIELLGAAALVVAAYSYFRATTQQVRAASDPSPTNDQD